MNQPQPFWLDDTSIHFPLAAAKFGEKNKQSSITSGLLECKFRQLRFLPSDCFWVENKFQIFVATPRLAFATKVILTLEKPERFRRKLD